jgi:hypothetical protein
MKMSFKILSLALMLLLIMAISGTVSGANSIGHKSISFNTASWCAIPVINVPSYTNLVPQIQISESHSNTATSWSISIATMFKFPRSSNQGVSAITAVPLPPVADSSLDMPEIITTSADADASNTLPRPAEFIDITPTDPTADTSDGSSLTLDPDTIIVDPFAEEPGTEISEDDTVSISIPTLTSPGDSEPINPDTFSSEERPLVLDANIDSSYEPEAANFPDLDAAFSNQDFTEMFHQLAQTQMNQMELEDEPFPEEPL